MVMDAKSSAESERGEGSAPLPQPTDPHAKLYRYLKFEQIKPEFFPDLAVMPPQTLCWVLLSKGKGKTPTNFKRARTLSPCDDGERIEVQYPKGSTYRVRKGNLMPVLEHHSHLVLVTSETNDYRRTAIHHTCADDHFLEIGCDFGILVDSVDCISRLGVDKSEASIRIARERYPNRGFLLGDIFEDDWDDSIKKPTVVAIDINGNRMLPAVLKCINLAIDKWSPRLIVVKSRELYAKMKEESSFHANEK